MLLSRETAAGDTGKRTPYILIGAHLKGFGQSKMTADSAVTLDRDSLHATADSIAVDRATISTVQLIGKPAHVRRAGADSFIVDGREIRFRLENDKLREMRSLLDASVVRGTTVINGDTVLLAFAAEKLGLTCVESPHRRVAAQFRLRRRGRLTGRRYAGRAASRDPDLQSRHDPESARHLDPLHATFSGRHVDGVGHDAQYDLG